MNISPSDVAIVHGPIREASLANVPDPPLFIFTLDNVFLSLLRVFKTCLEGYSNIEQDFI